MPPKAPQNAFDHRSSAKFQNASWQALFFVRTVGSEQKSEHRFVSLRFCGLLQRKMIVRKICWMYRALIQRNCISSKAVVMGYSCVMSSVLRVLGCALHRCRTTILKFVARSACLPRTLHLWSLLCLCVRLCACMCVKKREHHHACVCRRRRAARWIYDELYSGGGIDESIIRCHCAKNLEGVSPVFMHDNNGEMVFIL